MSYPEISFINLRSFYNISIEALKVPLLFMEGSLFFQSIRVDPQGSLGLIF